MSTIFLFVILSDTVYFLQESCSISIRLLYASLTLRLDKMLPKSVFFNSYITDGISTLLLKHSCFLLTVFIILLKIGDLKYRKMIRHIGVQNPRLD